MTIRSHAAGDREDGRMTVTDVARRYELGPETNVSRGFARYVAIGDSSTEGLDDPDGRGHYRGWANRLAAHVAAAQEAPLLYANLGIRGRSTRAVRDEQLAPALDMQPDLATVFAGTNDVISRRFDVAAVAADIESMQSGLIAAGATVLTFTLPDLGPVMPLMRIMSRGRVEARVATLNDALRSAARRTGAILVDFAAHPVASDPRLWSDDRLHANAAGHQRIAAALAAALELPGHDETWTQPLPPAPRRSLPVRAGRELHWVARYLMPWIFRHARGQSSGDGITPKRPRPTPVE